MALTKSDKTWVKNTLDKTLDEALDKQEQKFEAKVVEIKSEFFEKIDPVLKEVTTAREERPLIENRLEALEVIHPKGKHVLA